MLSALGDIAAVHACACSRTSPLALATAAAAVTSSSTAEQVAAAAGAHTRMMFCKIPGVGAGTAAKWYDLGYRWGRVCGVQHLTCLCIDRVVCGT